MSNGLPHRLKTAVFVLEGLNALATSIYFSYLFFHMRDRFGFTNQENLTLCATNGLVYCVAVWFAGRFAQRRGYLFALRLGFATMGLALLLASRADSVPTHYATMLLWTLGMCLTWPTLEALTSEGEPPLRLQRLLGIYNVVWATCAALAYFIGGALLEKLGPTSIFLVPAGLHGVQLGILAWLGDAPPHRASTETASAGPLHPEERQRSPVAPAVFLAMAWLANPFAYVAMNALIPVIPRLAERHALSPMAAGFFCSTLFFARAAAFVGLWLWSGWHYRFRWLAGAYAVMACAFAAILLVHHLPSLLFAQILFGAACGLLYYSSLYYSMDVGETKGEHGGFHEAALGAGVFAGPAVGAASLHFFPANPNVNIAAVSALLALGFLGLLGLRFRRRGPTPIPERD